MNTFPPNRTAESSQTSVSNENLSIDRKYAVALSFAGEDRKYAKALFDALSSRDINVFYDQSENEKADLWGKDLYAYLSDLYQNRAKYCVMFLSQHYANKLWTNHERESAQARAFKDNREYILPIRIDNTEIPGILPTIGYLNWSDETPDKIADLIVDKLKSRISNEPRQNINIQHT